MLAKDTGPRFYLNFRPGTVLGEKVSAAEVESLLLRHPRIAAAAVVAMPDPRLGERACAFVKPNGQREITLSILTQALEAAGVAKFKWPERLVLISELPLTPTQKVMRAKLAAQLGEEPGE